MRIYESQQRINLENGRFLTIPCTFCGLQVTLFCHGSIQVQSTIIATQPSLYVKLGSSLFTNQ